MSQEIKSFSDLRVWEEAHGLVIDLFHFTREITDNSLQDVVRALRLEVVQIPAHIAAGKGAVALQEYVVHLSQAKMALETVKYYLILCKDLQALSGTDYQYLDEKTNSIGRMLHALSNSLKQKE